MPSKFPQILKNLRLKRGLGVRAFARLSETSPSTVSNVENGTSTPPAASVKRWAKALKLEGAELAAFVEAAGQAKAEVKDDALPYLKEIRARADRADSAVKSLLAFLSPTNADAELEQSLQGKNTQDLTDLVIYLARANRRLSILALDPAALRSESLKEVLRALSTTRDLSLIPRLEALDAVLGETSDAEKADP